MDFQENMKKIGYCIDDEIYKKEISLSGTLFSSDVKLITVDILKCSPEIFPRGSYKIIITKYLDCASQEVIDQKLKSGTFGFIFTDYLID